jgi:cystine transport system substrate-binding protein
MDASYPPFEYIDGGGSLVGFDVDLADELAHQLSASTNNQTEIQVQFVANLPYDGLYDALTADRIDVVISALYVDPTRMDNYAYSASYFNGGQVLVSTIVTPLIEDVQDLAGLNLAVEFGSEGDAVARTWIRRLESLTILSCQTAEEALTKVISGEADAALVDHLSALAISAQNSDLQIVGDPVTDEPYAIAVRRESRELLQAIERALEEMEGDGTLAEMRQRWFAPNP